MLEQCRLIILHMHMLNIQSFRCYQQKVPMQSTAQSDSQRAVMKAVAHEVERVFQ